MPDSADACFLLSGETLRTSLTKESMTQNTVHGGSF